MTCAWQQQRLETFGFQGPKHRSTLPWTISWKFYTQRSCLQILPPTAGALLGTFSGILKGQQSSLAFGTKGGWVGEREACSGDFNYRKGFNHPHRWRHQTQQRSYAKFSWNVSQSYSWIKNSTFSMLLVTNTFQSKHDCLSITWSEQAGSRNRCNTKKTSSRLQENH